MCLFIELAKFQVQVPTTEATDTQDQPMDVSGLSAESEDVGGSASKPKQNYYYCNACRQRRRAERGLHFHRVPKKMHAKWAAACGEVTLPDKARVCSRHFLPQDYADILSGRLGRQAVPTQNLLFAVELTQEPAAVQEQGGGEAGQESGSDAGEDVPDQGEGDVGGGAQPMEDDSGDGDSDDDEFGCALQLAAELDDVCEGSAQDKEKLKALRQKVKNLQVCM